jgi:Zn-finger nucleic acid-binding protein
MAEVFTCPSCATPLEQMRLEHGVFWACARCGGRALSVELLRRTFAKEAINPLWLRVLSGAGRVGRNCPCCHHPMLEVDLTEKPETPMVDFCRLCHFVWFDASEIGELQPREIPAEPPAKRKPRSISSPPFSSLDEPPLHESWQQLIHFLLPWIG